MSHFDEQASELMRERVDELYEWLGPHVQDSALQIVGGWLSLSPIDRETVTDVLIATWAQSLCTRHPDLTAVEYGHFQHSFMPGFWEGGVDQHGRTHQATPQELDFMSKTYCDYIASKVKMAVHEYARHHHAEYAAAWQHELLGSRGLTLVKLIRLGEKATNFIRWRLVYVEEEVRRDPTDSQRLDELMWPADKLMRLAEVYAQSAEHRFGIYCHLLTSLTQLYSAHNMLNSAARDEKVDDAERLREAVVEWTSPAALAAFRAQVPEYQAHIVSHARFEILKVCRKLHSSTRLPNVEAVVQNMSNVTFDPIEWPDFATTSNESAEPKPHERMRSLAHAQHAQISDYYARRHYNTTAADWSRRRTDRLS